MSFRAGASLRIALLALCAVAWSCGTSKSSGGFAPGGSSGSSGGGASSGGGSSGGDDGGASLVGDGGGGGGGGGTSGGGCSDAANAKTNSGCEYYAVEPDIIIGGRGACFAAFVANDWTSPVTISVDYGGQALDASKFSYLPIGSGKSLQYVQLANGVVNPGQVAILFLSKFTGAIGAPPPLNYNCPTGVTPAITTMDTAPHGTTLGSAFHISTSGPVVAYDIYPFGGGQSAETSATLLLPTTAWGTNYIAVDGYAQSALSGGNPFVAVTAAQNGTTVTVSPTAAIAAGKGVAGTAQGVSQTYTLQQGQVLQFSQPAELSGSVIASNNPVGVWGGHSALNVGVNDCCADSSHQQIPPVRALGNEYTGVRYRNRYVGQEESPPWRLVGAVNGTQLTYEPAAPAGAPTALALGQVADFDSNGPFVVRSQDSQHPFYFAAYMTGAGPYDPNETDGRGDSEFVNVVPPAEDLSSYVFFTDPTYPETDLVIVRAQGSGAFADVTLDCSGVVTGWQPVGSSGNYEYARVDLVTGDFVGQNGCSNGRHEIKSTAPFGLTVWGWGSAATGNGLTGFYTQYVSYAYPAGASIAPINMVVVPPSNQ
jgi:hypothetical protein